MLQYFLNRKLGKKKSERELDMSRLGIVLIVVILAIGGVGAYFLMRPQPNFQVENLSLPSDPIIEGETVMAQVEVTNTGDAEGTHIVRLEVGNENLKKEVNLDAGESRTVSFDFGKEEKGTYDLNVENLSETFEVLEPAEFEVSNLQVSPEEVEPNQDVEVSVDVRNIGGVEGTKTLELNVDENTKKTKDITLGGGESTTFSFSVTKKKPETYSVGIGDLSGSFEVLEPAKFELSNLAINPSKVNPGEPVDVSVDVVNVGEVIGENIVKLWINGNIEKTQTVTLKGGESNTITFTVQKKCRGKIFCWNWKPFR